MFPSLVIRSQENLPLTEQVVYDLRNEMRKASEINEFDDEDYSEDEDIEFINNENPPPIELVSLPISRSTILHSIISTPTTTTATTTTRKTTITIPTTTTISSEKNIQHTEVIETKASNTQYQSIPSSSSFRIVPMFICLLFSFSIYCIEISSCE